MHYLLHAVDPETGKDFSLQQLKAKSGLSIAAGADTTATVLAARLFYLLHNPRVLDTLLKEIRSTVSAQWAEEVSLSKLISLPYLRVVIDETLQLPPPVPSLLPREVLKGGLRIEGELIPEGTVVGVAAYAIHRNPKYYDDPARFYPERWMTGPGHSSSSRPSPIPCDVERSSPASQAFSPFSHGAEVASAARSPTMNYILLFPCRCTATICD